VKAPNAIDGKRAFDPSMSDSDFFQPGRFSGLTAWRLHAGSGAMQGENS